MKKEFTLPTSETIAQIRKAKADVVGRKHRNLLCPYCRHCSILVFDDASGHVQTKCKVCGKETVFDLTKGKVISRPLNKFDRSKEKII